MIIILYSSKISGGGERDRTDDLLRARQALSQLSYTPGKIRFRLRLSKDISLTLTSISLVGLDRLELSTSRLSGVRSNQLSYRPSIKYKR